MSKGSKQRPTDTKRFNSNMDRIFGNGIVTRKDNKTVSEIEKGYVFNNQSGVIERSK